MYTDQWIVPGGGIEPGESHTDALLREVSEETGLDITSATVWKLEKVSTGKSEKTLNEQAERVLVAMRFYDFEVMISKQSSEVSLLGQDDFYNATWFDVEKVGSLQLGPATESKLESLNFLKLG